MPEVLTIELKSDLERIYKIAGDLLNSIEMQYKGKENGVDAEMLDLIRFKLMDITGTLQKDIFNCDYLITKIKTTGAMEQLEHR